MKTINDGGMNNLAKDLHRILVYEFGNSIEEISEKYDIPKEALESMSYSVYVNNNDKIVFKGGKTNFSKLYTEGVKRLMKEGIVTISDMGFMTVLSSFFTSIEDNFLRIDDKLVGKNELIKFIISELGLGESESSLRRKFKSLEDKGLLMVYNHPTEKQKKIYYLTPLLFYKGKNIEAKTLKTLMSAYREIHTLMMDKIDKGEIDIKLNPSFDKLSDEDKLVMATRQTDLDN